MKSNQTARRDICGLLYCRVQFTTKPHRLQAEQAGPLYEPARGDQAESSRRLLARGGPRGTPTKVSDTSYGKVGGQM